MKTKAQKRKEAIARIDSYSYENSKSCRTGKKDKRQWLSEKNQHANRIALMQN